MNDSVIKAEFVDSCVDFDFDGNASTTTNDSPQKRKMALLQAHNSNSDTGDSCDVPLSLLKLIDMVSCSVCSKKFTRNADRLRHERQVHVKKPNLMTCLHCDKVFKSKKSMLSHCERCAKNPDRLPLLSCEECGGFFSTARSLESHKRYSHSLSSSSQLLSSSNLDLDCNLNSSTPDLQSCPFCDSKFTRFYDVKMHVKIVHSKTKDFTCSVCLRSFGRKAHLNRHMANLHSKGKMCINRSERQSKSVLNENENLVSKPTELSDSSDLAELGLVLPVIADANNQSLHVFDDTGSKTKTRKSKGKIPCPLKKICRTMFRDRYHVQVHLSTTHGHLFARKDYQDVVKKFSVKDKTSKSKDRKKKKKKKMK